MRAGNSVKTLVYMKDGEQMKHRPRQEIQAYRGHAIERFEMEFGPSVTPEEHGTNSLYECGVSIIEEKESA